jgi:NADH-quinone oxidoreductase subunit A
MPESSSPYLPILMVAGLATAFAAVLLSLSTVVSWLTMRGTKRSPIKDTPYECGMPVLTDAHTRFSVKFYIVAMLFILFDIEVVFLYPWAVLYGRPIPFLQDALGTAAPLGFLFLELLVFVAVLFVGWLYVVRKGVLEWQRDG